MSLKAFHLLFAIIVGIFLITFGSWCVGQYREQGSVPYLVLGILSVCTGLLIPVYLRWLLKKLKGIGFVSLLLLVSRLGEACPVCLGDATQPLVKSMNGGVIFLLVMTASVLIPLAATFIYWAVKSRRLDVAAY